MIKSLYKTRFSRIAEKVSDLSQTGPSDCFMTTNCQFFYDHSNVVKYNNYAIIFIRPNIWANTTCNRVSLKKEKQTVHFDMTFLLDALNTSAKIKSVAYTSSWPFVYNTQLHVYSYVINKTLCLEKFLTVMVHRSVEI